MVEKKIDLLKNVFNKIQYAKTINTSFTELGITSVAEDLAQQPSVDKFFELYNSLFYDIPPNGETNSHEFLVRQSGEYINFERNVEEIEALQAEITQLRKDLLGSQIENIEIRTGKKLNLDVNSLEGNVEELTEEVNSIKQSLEVPELEETPIPQETNNFTLLSSTDN